MNRKTLIQFAQLGKQIAFLLPSLSGQIMASIVIQFVRLVAPYHDLVRKSSELPQEGYKLPNLLTMRPPLKVSTN